MLRADRYASAACRSLRERLDLTQMVLAVQKKLKTININIHNSFCFNNFAQKSIPGVVRAQVLQEPVGASHGGQGRKSGIASMFWDPGGQEESNGTKNLGGCYSFQHSPGGVVVGLYVRISQKISLP